MKHILTISLCLLALSLSAQETITYPYNPDGDADGLVAVPDLQDLLSVYGNPFSPAEIMIGDSISLSSWVSIIQNQIESLSPTIAIHGHFVVQPNSELEWIVPPGVIMIEIELSAGSGSTGGGSLNCPYSGGYTSGCGGGAGGMCRFLLRVVEGETIQINSGYTPDSPDDIGGCGNGLSGYTGLPSSFLLNGIELIQVTGGGGGNGIKCPCGSAYYHCGQNGPAPGNGSVLMPDLDSGVIILDTGISSAFVGIGGGWCAVRY